MYINSLDKLRMYKVRFPLHDYLNVSQETFYVYLLIQILQESHLFFFLLFSFCISLPLHALLCAYYRVLSSSTLELIPPCVNHGCGSSHRQSDHPITMNLTSMTMTLLSMPITMGLSSEPITINLVGFHHESLLLVCLFCFCFQPN